MKFELEKQAHRQSDAWIFSCTGIALCESPSAVRSAILEAVRQLAHLSQQFDRERAVLIAPSLTEADERYNGIAI